jgi:hypothetical protein
VASAASAQTLTQRYVDASPGASLSVTGDHPHFKVDRADGGAGGAIRVLGPALLHMNPSGGSDTISIQRAANVEFYQLTLEPDDRAAVMFGTKRHYPGIHFFDCRIGLSSGTGWNAETASGFKGKWGVLSYQLDDFLFQGGEVIGIAKEHCFYHHNPRAASPQHNAIVIRRVTMKWAGRTAVQVVSRAGEGPPGRGNVVIEACTIEDVCLEDNGGGSALTFRGNLDGGVLIRDTSVHLGGNPRLHPSVNRNITGALVMDSGSGAQGMGTRDLVIDGCRFEIGPHFVGKGSARRPNVVIGQVKHVVIRATRILNHPGSDNALVLELPSIDEVYLDEQNEIRGDIEVSGVGSFPDPGRTGAGYAALRTACKAAGDPDGKLIDRIRWFDSSE